jgi:prevent-host-death family protein
MKINIHEAKTHFSRLIERAADGEEVIIAKAGKPVARLVPVKRQAGSRVFGRDRGKFKVPANFNAPLPRSILRGFEG